MKLARLIVTVAVLLAAYATWDVYREEPEPNRTVDANDMFDPPLYRDETPIAGPPSRWP